MSRKKKFKISEKFVLQSGKTLPEVNIVYQTWGKLNDEKVNAILVCHALTGDSGVADYYDENSEFHEGWWRDIVGENRIIDTSKYFIICSNVIGSCYGSSGPTSINPLSGEKYNMAFPVVTVRDMVKVQKKLMDFLKVENVHTIIGASLGGMQALEWALLFPENVERVISIATCAQHSAWGIGLNEVARKAIMNDPVWNNGEYTEQPKQGLGLARMEAMLSYRSSESIEKRFGRDLKSSENIYEIDNSSNFQIESYLHYQGDKLVERFDANSYLYITKAIDLHDVTLGRGRLSQVLGNIRAKVICVGVSSDLLYPVQLQKDIAEKIPDSEYKEIHSIHGHDGFLIEQDQLSGIIHDFYEKSEKTKICI